MDKFVSEYLENAIQFVNSPIFPQLIKSLPSPETMKTVIHNASMASKLTLSPEVIKTLHNISLDIAQLSTAFQKIDSLPKADFQKIKNIVCENHSQIYDAVHDTMETVSSSTGQAVPDNNDETLIMPEQVAELVNTVDDSLKFSEPDSNKQVHIKKSDTDYPKIISILVSIISFLVTLAAFSYDVYQSNATTKLLEKNHSEQMQATYNQTEQLENLNEAIAKISQLLEQIEEKTSSNQNKD